MATNGEEWAAEMLAEDEEWSTAERSQIARGGRLMDRIESLEDLADDKTMRAADRVQLSKVLGALGNQMHKIEHELRQGQKSRAKMRGPGAPAIHEQIAGEIAQRHREFAARDPLGYADAVALFGDGPAVASDVDLLRDVPAFSPMALPYLPRPGAAERPSAALDDAPPPDARPDPSADVSEPASGPDDRNAYDTMSGSAAPQWSPPLRPEPPPPVVVPPPWPW